MVDSPPAVFEPVGCPPGQPLIPPEVPQDPIQRLQLAMNMIDALRIQNGELVAMVNSLEQSMVNLRLNQSPESNSHPGSGSWLKLGKDLSP